MGDFIILVLAACVIVIAFFAVAFIYIVAIGFITFLIAFLLYPVLAFLAPTLFWAGGISFLAFWAIIFVVGLVVSIFSD